VIVPDASLVVELLINSPLANAIRPAIRDERLIAPHLLDIEVASALRSMTAGKRIDFNRSGQLLIRLADLPVERYPHTPLLGRIWELRHNFTAYDAAYVALAEATDSVLYTCDEKLSKGHKARVKVFRS
jgi:predicted nucleic acid-binding protein